LKSGMVEKMEMERVLGEMRTIITVGDCSRKYLKVGYNNERLLILPYTRCRGSTWQRPMRETTADGTAW
jgi:hypothetical protein